MRSGRYRADTLWFMSSWLRNRKTDFQDIFGWSIKIKRFAKFLNFQTLNVFISCQHVIDHLSTPFVISLHDFVTFKLSNNLSKLYLCIYWTSKRETSKMQKVARHIGHDACLVSQVSLSLWSCLLANQRPKHETHHIGRQKQFEQLCWRQLLLILTSGVEIIQAKQVASTRAAGDTYFGFFLASATKTSMKRSISDVWNFTDDRIVIGRLILSCRSLN